MMEVEWVHTPFGHAVILSGRPQLAPPSAGQLKEAVLNAVAIMHPERHALVTVHADCPWRAGGGGLYCADHGMMMIPDPNDESPLVVEARQPRLDEALSVLHAPFFLP